MFGFNIRQQRELMELTQYELSKIVGVQIKDIQAWEDERKEPNIEQLCILSQTFQIPIDRLVGNFPVDEDGFEDLDAFDDDECDDKDCETCEEYAKCVIGEHILDYCMENEGAAGVYAEVCDNDENNTMIFAGDVDSVSYIVNALAEQTAIKLGMDYYDYLKMIATTRTLGLRMSNGEE